MSILKELQAKWMGVCARGHVYVVSFIHLGWVRACYACWADWVYVFLCVGGPHLKL